MAELKVDILTLFPEMFDAVLSLENREECYQFFEDVCTVNEILDLAQRFDVACMLTQGKIYTEISKETGASTATISRVNKCLNYGSGGYRSALDKLQAAKEAQ